MGSRALKSWLMSPQRARATAQQRLHVIGQLRDGHAAKLRSQLKGVTDIERVTARIALRQVRPRELVGLQQTLQKCELLEQVLLGLEAYFS